MDSEGSRHEEDLYRDQVVVASGGGDDVTGNNGNIFESNSFSSCYDFGDVGTYLLQSWFGDCAWIA